MGYQINDSNQYRLECLRRYYANMDIVKAKDLLVRYRKESRKKADIFIKRINKAKGYNAL